MYDEEPEDTDTQEQDERNEEDVHSDDWGDTEPKEDDKKED